MPPAPCSGSISPGPRRTSSGSPRARRNGARQPRLGSRAAGPAPRLSCEIAPAHEHMFACAPDGNTLTRRDRDRRPGTSNRDPDDDITKDVISYTTVSDTARVGSATLFPTDHPLDPGIMIGRRSDVDRISTALVGGGNVVLAGPRRTGKTTVADAALVACRADGAYVAGVDLFECADAGALAHLLTLELLANRARLRRAIHDAISTGRSVLDALRPAATIRARQDLGDDIELTIDLARAEEDPADALYRAPACAAACGA